jgi:uncharacterized protein
MFFFSPLWLILIAPCIVLALIAQMLVSSAFGKYSKVRASSGLTGAEAARLMLREAGLEGKVEVERVDGFLSDHYDPRKKVLRLSPKVYDEPSLAAVGVACHEAGHAVQDARGYAPLVVRNFIVPAAGIGSQLGMILIFVGLIFAAFRELAIIGLVLYGAVAVFQVVNLPVEFNASARAKQMLPRLGILQSRQESAAVATVLNAAALTYVAATITAVAHLLYYALLIFGGGSRNR